MLGFARVPVIGAPLLGRVGLKKSVPIAAIFDVQADFHVSDHQLRRAAGHVDLAHRAGAGDRGGDGGAVGAVAVTASV